MDVLRVPAATRTACDIMQASIPNGEKLVRVTVDVPACTPHVLHAASICWEAFSSVYMLSVTRSNILQWCAVLAVLYLAHQTF